MLLSARLAGRAAASRCSPVGLRFATSGPRRLFFTKSQAWLEQKNKEERVEPAALQKKTNPPTRPAVLHEDIYTIPNILTFTRLIAAPAIGYLVLHDHHAWAVGLFAYAGVTDLLDGWIARRWNSKTVVGTVIDPMADKTLMTILTVCLAIKGALPIWVATVILGRDVGLAISAIYYRWISLPPPKTFARYWDFSLPENTIRAFKKAIELDIDGVELDVWISKDGVPIIVHGDDNGIVAFKDASLNRHATEIDSKDLNEWLLPNGEAIPTLEDVLFVCKNRMRVNIELKEETRRPVLPTIELLLKLNMLDHICFSSFFHQHKIWIEEARRELKIEHPIEFGFLVWETKDFGEVLNVYGTEHDTLNIDIDLLLKHEDFTLAEMTKAQDRGLRIKFYFGFEQPENSEIYQRLRKLKVDTLIINHPLTVLEYIAVEPKAV